MRFEVDCANSSRQFGDHLSGFGRQSEKFSRIGACIRRNLTPWTTIIIIWVLFYAKALEVDWPCQPKGKRIHNDFNTI